MFDSGISVKNLIDELKNTEIDIALDIPDATYVTWLNSLQQLLYTEIIKEQRKHIEEFSTVFPDKDNQMAYYNFDLSSIQEGENESKPRFEDIHAVYADDVQLIKSTLASGFIFPNTYFKDNNNIGYRVAEGYQSLTIIYFVRPALVTTTSHGNVSDGVNVMLPIEFIDLVKAKLRGEAYKLANEDALAAKWLNDYNILLETFKAWIAEKSPNFGI